MNRTPWIKRVLGDSESNDQLKALSEELARKLDEVQDLSEDLRTTRTELEERHLQLREAKKQEDLLRVAVSAAELRAKEGAEACSSADKKLQRAIEAEQQWERTRKESARTAVARQRQLVKLRREREEQEARLAEWASRFEELDKKYTDVCQQFTRVTTRAGDAEQKVRAAREQLQQVRRKFEQLEGNMSKQVEQRVASASEKSRKKLEACTAEIFQLQEQCKELTASTSACATREGKLRRATRTIVRLVARSSHHLLGDRAHLLLELASGGEGEELGLAGLMTSRELDPVEQVARHLQELGLGQTFVRTERGVEVVLVKDLDPDGGVAQWVLAYSLICLNALGAEALRIDSIVYNSGGAVEAVCSPCAVPLSKQPLALLG